MSDAQELPNHEGTDVPNLDVLWQNFGATLPQPYRAVFFRLFEQQVKSLARANEQWSQTLVRSAQRSQELERENKLLWRSIGDYILFNIWNLSDTECRILELVARSKTRVTSNEAAKAVGCSEGHAREAMGNLKKHGLLKGTKGYQSVVNLDWILENVPNGPAENPIPGLIALARRKTGMTQADLAARVGIGQAMMAHIEKNRKQPTADRLRRIISTLEEAARATNRASR